jgi:hypothetical protein
VNIRLGFCAFGVLLGYVVGCGGDSGGTSPCVAICNCVVKEKGDTARSQCATECADARKSSDPVGSCHDRLSENAVTTCDDTCDALATDPPQGTGGKGGKPGSGGAGGSGGSDDTGGTSGDTGGTSPAGGTGGKNVGTGGGTNTGGSGGTPPATGMVGAECHTNADCGEAALTCLTTTGRGMFNGGPAGGLCVADCAVDSSVCATIDPSSTCVEITGSNTSAAYCLEACTIAVDPSGKCHGREDLACDDGNSTTGDGFCRPACRNDADCGTRVCNFGNGVCVDASAITGTLPIGSPCDPSATTDPCAGLCVALTDDDAGPGVCGGLCTLGVVGCGTDEDAPGTPQASCLFGFTTSDGDVGDLGLCGQLCDCDADCTAYQRVCRPFDADEAQDVGRPGYCGGVNDSTGNVADHLSCGPSAG